MQPEFPPGAELAAPAELLAELPADVEGRLRTYEALLAKWQKAINLVAPSTLAESWTRHFMDSLQILPLIPAGPVTLYDLGCGAGFPGMVLAMARPELDITLIESDERKGAFLTCVSHETKTVLRVHTGRIEQAAVILPPPDVITARALAALPDLLRMIRPWVGVNPRLRAIFPKGAQWAAEIAQAREVAHFHLADYPSHTSAESRILVLDEIVYV